jgi:SAM-dependent methyltransferase
VIRRVARLAVGVAARLVPDRVLDLVFRAWLDRIARREPAAALRRLLVLEHEVYARVDRTAIVYDGGVHAKHRLMRYHDFFVERVRPGERVLDVGCGKGELASDLAERGGASVVGIDVNEEYLDFARSRYGHGSVEFVRADALSQLPPGPFDVVVLSNVLEHIGPRIELLRRLVERARPRRILVRVPLLARDWLVPLRRELGLPYFSDATHEIEYDVAGLEAELREAGLEPAEVQVLWGEIWAEARPAH